MPQDDSHAQQRVVVGSDEDWKERVKAEDAALDERLKAESPSDDKARGDAQAREKEDAAGPKAEKPAGQGAGQPLPPPTFSTLVTLFSTQAMVALGLLANPATGKAEPQLELARHFIDMLGVLEEKTQRNLTGREHDLLETTLHQLRMTYVEVAKSGGQST